VAASLRAKLESGEGGLGHELRGLQALAGERPVTDELVGVVAAAVLGNSSEQALRHGAESAAQLLQRLPEAQAEVSRALARSRTGGEGIWHWGLAAAASKLKVGYSQPQPGNDTAEALFSRAAAQLQSGSLRGAQKELRSPLLRAELATALGDGSAAELLGLIEMRVELEQALLAVGAHLQTLQLSLT